MSQVKVFITGVGVDTGFLVELMRKASPGEIVTYAAMNAACGRDVQGNRHLIDSARRILRREHSMVFRAVDNEGYRRLADDAIVDTVNADRRNRMRRQAAVAVQELSCAKYDDLDRDKQVKHNTGLALFGSLYQATSRQSVARLHQRVVNAGGSIDLSGTLKMIGWLVD